MRLFKKRAPTMQNEKVAGQILQMITTYRDNYYSFDGRHCKCYVLDTGIDWWDWITDDRKAQMDWLAEQLKKDNPNHAIIFMHIICNGSGVLSENAKGIEKILFSWL